MHKRFEQYICQHGYGFKFNFFSFDWYENFVSFEYQTNYECMDRLHILKSRLRDWTFQKWNNLEGNWTIILFKTLPNATLVSCPTHTLLKIIPINPTQKTQPLQKLRLYLAPINQGCLEWQEI